MRGDSEKEEKKTRHKQLKHLILNVVLRHLARLICLFHRTHSFRLLYSKMQSPMKTYYILLQLICSSRCYLLLNQHVYTDEI